MIRAMVPTSAEPQHSSATVICPWPVRGRFAVSAGGFPNSLLTTSSGIQALSKEVSCDNPSDLGLSPAALIPILPLPVALGDLPPTGKARDQGGRARKAIDCIPAIHLQSLPIATSIATRVLIPFPPTERWRHPEWEGILYAVYLVRVVPDAGYRNGRTW
ncbi:hypothetical protein VTI74DRAFT_1468 [Chaetomium olivicolor]